MWYDNLMKTSSFSHTKIFQNSIETKSLVFHDNYLLKHCYRSYDFGAVLIFLSIVLVQVLDVIIMLTGKWMTLYFYGCAKLKKLRQLSLQMFIHHYIWLFWQPIGCIHYSIKSFGSWKNHRLAGETGEQAQQEVGWLFPTSFFLTKIWLFLVAAIFRFSCQS